MPQERTFKIRLSPLSRLYFTLDREVALGRDIFSEPARYERFLKMHELAERKRDLIIRNMLALDSIVLLLIFGKAFTIPGLNVSINDIPAAREVVTFAASLTFQFAALAFLNWHGYAAIVDTINIHKFNGSGVDPEFVAASDRFLEFFVKLYRPKMNIRGIDFAEPSKQYMIMARIVNFLLMTSVASFLLLHLTVVFVSGRESINSLPSSLLLYVYLAFLVFVNLGGLLIWTTTTRDFEFTVTDHTEANPPRGT